MRWSNHLSEIINHIFEKCTLKEEDVENKPLDFSGLWFNFEKVLDGKCVFESPSEVCVQHTYILCQ